MTDPFVSRVEAQRDRLVHNLDRLIGERDNADHRITQTKQEIERISTALAVYRQVMSLDGAEADRLPERVPTVGDATLAALRRRGGRARALDLYTDLRTQGLVKEGGYTAVNNALNRDKNVRRVGRGLYEYVSPVSGSTAMVVTVPHHYTPAVGQVVEPFISYDNHDQQEGAS
jgi:hypothetical protein